MKIIRTLVASVVTLLLVVVLPLAGVCYLLDRTLLDAGFVKTEVMRLDPVTQLQQALKVGLPPDPPQAAHIVEATVTETRPVLEAQIGEIIDGAHGYLTGRIDQVDIPLNSAPVLAALKRQAVAELRANPAPEVKDLPPEKLDDYVEQGLAQALKRVNVPEKLTLDLLPADTRQSLDELRERLQFARKVINIAYVAAVALAALAWLLGSLRFAATGLLMGGGLVFAGQWGLEAAAHEALRSNLGKLPESLRPLIPGLIDHLIAPLGTFALGCVGLGAALFILSFFIRRKPAAPPLVATDPAAAPEPPPPPRPDPAPITWVKQNRGITAGLVALVVGVLALGPGHAIARIQAARLRSAAQAAEAAGDWAATLQALKSATQARPTDPELADDYQSAQVRWLHTVDAKIASMSPEERWAFFASAPEAAIRAQLSEPLASAHAAFIEQNRALVCDHIDQAFHDAATLLDQHEWAKAQARVDGLKSVAAADPEFAHASEVFADQQAARKMAAASAFIRSGQLADARQLLADLKDNPRLEANEVADATYRANLAEFQQQIDAAVDAGVRGNVSKGMAQLGALGLRAKALQADPAHARVWSELSEEERARVLPNFIAQGRARLLQAAVTASIPALADAIRTGRAAPAQAVLDNLAPIAGHAFSATGETLVSETDFSRFRNCLAELGLSDRASPAYRGADVALVESVRSRFSDQTAVKAFVGAGYAAWSDQLAKADRPAAALYLLDLAAREGVSRPAIDRLDLLSSLQENSKRRIALAPVTTSPDSVNSDVADLETALRQTLAKAGTDWITVETPAAGAPEPALLVRAVAEFPAEQGNRSHSNWSVHYQSGTRTDPNPDYNSLVAQLDDAQRSLESAREAAQQAESQSSAASDNALAGAIMAAASAYGGAAVDEAASRVNSLNNQLARTSPTITTAVYADENIPITTHEMNHSAKLEATVLEHGRAALRSATWFSQLYYHTYEWPGSRRAGVTAGTPNFVARATASRRLEQSLAAMVTHQPALLLQPVADALFHEADEANAKDSPADQAEKSWGLVELWLNSGLRVTSYATREAALRRSLGLPAPDSASLARVPQADHTYYNCLGQILVPLPGVPVLIATQETKVDDFKKFVSQTHHEATKGSKVFSLSTDGWAQNGRTWADPGFAQEPNHPVCAVSWTDAMAYCAWLTEKEQAAGLIAADQEYRLPTDAEWSLAAGLANEPAGTPEQKSRKVQGYGWGTAWPPLPGSANLAMAEAGTKDWPGKWGTIKDLSDGYSRTSPVGRYSANALGVYDLDGNVQEWVLDSFDGKSADKTIRGASFITNDSASALLSDRTRLDPAARFVCVGFRVVLTLGHTAR